MERVVASLSRRYPGRAAGVPEFSEPLAHLLLAAADYLVVPSRFEPCGLVALAALRYGCPVVAAATGGLVDIVTPDVGYTFEAPPPPPTALTASTTSPSAAEAAAAPQFRRAVAALADGVARAAAEYGSEAYAARRAAGMARPRLGRTARRGSGRRCWPRCSRAGTRSRSRKRRRRSPRRRAGERALLVSRLRRPTTPEELLLFCGGRSGRGCRRPPNLYFFFQTPFVVLTPHDRFSILE